MTSFREIGPDTTHLSRWREHIDGLRAIAVLSVLFHHAGLAGFPGGYVGVDIFFVISGFLISKVIYKEIQTQGRFSLLAFYERRIRRIFPAFAVVTIAVLLLGSLLFPPDRLEQLGASALYATGFAANVHFYLTADYFGPAAETQPLLHYWSLGVEEQFYILFPLAVLAVWRTAPRLLLPAICLAALASLALAETDVRSGSTAAFYLAPQRAWELLAGGLLALPATPSPNSRAARETLSGLGLALILLAVFAYDPDMPFPGLAALLPVLGSAFVIWGCDTGPTVAGRLLALGPLRRIGLWSYSIYMVHWPLIVFAREGWPDADPALLAMAAIPASVALGWMSYRWVELPFRPPGQRLLRRRLLAAATACLAVLFLAGGTLDATRGLAFLQKQPVGGMFAYSSYDYRALYREGECFLLPEQGWDEFNRRACLRPGPPSVLLWGDSHMAHLFAALERRFAGEGIAVSMAAASLCQPALGLEVAGRPHCRGFNDRVLDWAVETRPERVYLSALWETTTLDHLDATVAALTKVGLPVTIIGQGPLYGSGVPGMLAERLERGDEDRFDEGGHAIAGIEAAMRDRYAGNPLVSYVSFLDTLCRDGRCPIRTEEGVPVQWDNSHFTAEGADLAASRMFGRLWSGN